MFVTNIEHGRTGKAEGKRRRGAIQINGEGIAEIRNLMPLLGVGVPAALDDWLD